MNRERLLGILRHLLTTTGGILVADGLLPGQECAASVTEIGVRVGGATLTALGFAWSYFAPEKRVF